MKNGSFRRIYMNVRYIESMLALLIGLAPIAYGSENNVSEQSLEVHTAQVRDEKSIDVTVQDAQKTPFLIPFDLRLYKVYCQSKQSTYQWSVATKLVSVAVGAVIISSQLNAFIKNPASFAPITSKGISDWWSNRWYWLIPMVIYKGIPSGLWSVFQVGSFAAMVYNTCTSAVSLESDATNYFLWDDREELFSATDKLKSSLEMQKIWHEEVYARLGRPAIIGDISLEGKYLIKGFRNGIEMIFDPFNREHVRALLGFNPNESCWRFEKIEIILV